MSDNLRLPFIIQKALTSTPARLFTGRSGTACLTSTLLQLRADHATARDAVFDDFVVERDFSESWLSHHQLLELRTQAISRSEYLQCPHRGRLLNEQSAQLALSQCPHRPQLQLILADGLSAKAMLQQGPPLHDLIQQMATATGLTLGRTLLIHQCRVGIMNDIGRLLQPEIVILLIGERPGLTQAYSLSAYLAYQPQPGHTDAQRCLVSNIHSQGIATKDAANRIMDIMEQMRQIKASGVMIQSSI